MRGLCGCAVLALFTWACASEPSGPAPRLEATVMRATDTIRFHARAAAYRCKDGRGLLFEAVSHASGVLVWLRGAPDSTTGSYAVLGTRDSVTRRGAIVAVRFAAQAVPHTVSLDSGTVVVSDSGDARRIAISGSGLDLNGGTRPALRATFTALPAPTDSAPCAR
jgi:hypothetical protein